jgi:hypothetical protein
MEPALYTGDLVMVQKQDDYRVGDTVLTQVYGGLVMHNIVWLSDSSVRTQGLNNDFEDTWTLPRSAILGKQIFVVKQFGAVLVRLRTEPLLFGSFAAVLGGLFLIDPRKHKRSKRLAEILATAEHELPQVKKSHLNSMLVGFYVLGGVSILATGVLLANNVKFYPRILLGLSGLVVSIIAFEVLGNWLVSGRDLPEPEKSLAIFGKHLYRVHPDIHIDGLTRPVSKASELVTFAEIARTPILHLILGDDQVHKFIVVTDDLNYVFTVDLGLEEHKRGRHKK